MYPTSITRFLLPLLWTLSLVHAAPPINTDIFLPGSPTNTTTVTSNVGSNVNCYSKYRYSKPKLIPRSCQMVSNWRAAERQAARLGQVQDWIQPNDYTGHLIPQNDRENYDGCRISVFARTPGARARVSLEAILQVSDQIYRSCERSGRGGTSRLVGDDDRPVPDWFVKLDSLVRL